MLCGTELHWHVDYDFYIYPPLWSLLVLNLHYSYLIHQVQQNMSSINSNLICSRKKSLSSPLGQLVRIVLEFCSENLWTQRVFSAKVYYLLYKSQNGNDGTWAMHSNCSILHWWGHCSIYGPICNFLADQNKTKFHRPHLSLRACL